MDFRRMRCASLVGFLGVQLGYSLPYVFVMRGRFFCLFYLVYFLVTTCQLHLLSGETMDAEGGSQGANPTLTTDL